MSPMLEKDTTPFALNIMKSDNPAVQRDGKLEPEGRTFSTFCNVFEVPSGIPLPWRYIVGSLLTVIYLVGAILLFSFYLIQNNKNGVSTVMDDKFVSLKDLQEAENDGYICTCDFPPEIRSVVKEDTRKKTLNRCYNPEEAETVRGELNILQYNSLWDVVWSYYISQLTNKKPKSRAFNDGLRPEWKSYELRALKINESSDVPLGIHLANLSSKLDDKGYVGQVGYTNLAYLIGDDFLTVPPGFIQATIQYNCTSCSACELLWNKYDSVQAKDASNEYSWAFCDENSSHVPGQVEGCSGFCRYIRTHDRPWGVELNKMALELEKIVDAPQDTTVIFHPRILYANISEVEHDVSYTLSFLEVDREGTTWLRFTDYFGPIQKCGENKNKVVICSGSSICEIAPTYSFQSANSEELNAQCEFYATGPDYQINRTKCEEIVSEADLRFVINLSNTSVSDDLCKGYQCEEVIRTRVVSNKTWITGEAALNKLVYETAFLARGDSEFCTTNYTDVLVVYEDENEEGKGFGERILSIHKLDCSSGNSKGSGNSKLCWLTDRYKNMTDTWQEPWKQYVFSADETESGKTMFACYKFREKSLRSRMWDFFGIVSGIIGSWLLILSCIYWGFLRTSPRKLEFLFGPVPSQSDDPAPAPSVSSNIYEGEKTKSTWESRLDVETNRRMADFPSERIGPYTL